MKYKYLALSLALSIGLCGCVATDNTELASTEENMGLSDEAKEGASKSPGSDTSDGKDLSENAELSDGKGATGSLELPELNVIDDKYRTTYEIFVYSFYDSDGDGIGDLQGVKEKLDYVNDGDDSTFTDLGCNEIWLMPISTSPTYHKYDITDYMDIDPEYGTLEDFDELVKACHDRGINLIIDLVLNHTSVEHPWFKEASQYLKDNAELENLYTAGGDIIPELKEECPYLYYYNFSKDEQTGYEKLNGTNWYYEARFWSGMPDLNLDNDDVKAEIADITQFWTDKGVDGFRLDAVTSYYTDDDESNIRFMTWLNDTVKSQNPEAYIVGEAWTASATYAEYYKSGVDSFFDFDFSGSEGMIASVARSKKSAASYAEALEKEEELFASKSSTYVNAPFYTNHDMARSAGYFTGKGSENKVKLAGALNLLMGGNAFIYYGEELGMKGSGKDENKRAPMQWISSDEGDYAGAVGMCDGPADMESFDMIYPGLDEQESDPYSIYNYFKAAIRLRNTYPVIARGKTQAVEELSGDRLGAFVRFLDDSDEKDKSDAQSGEGVNYGPESLLVLINNGEEETEVELSKWSGISDSPKLCYQLLVSEEEVSLTGTTVTLPAYSIAVIE